ncbi:MAG TPA: sugar ABC transporter substrate-binding protein [Burkholderiaceae bacterium]|nr:sugar ABC transporter substrate-binding protein [Burkholderiaceae bacterium]
MALAACTRPGDRALRFWTMGREGEVVGELLSDFAREHRGITVRVEQLPWTAAHEKLLTAFAGDATPDVAQLGNTWIAELAALGALEPLQPWLDGERSIVGADYFDGIWRTNQIDGTQSTTGSRVDSPPSEEGPARSDRSGGTLYGLPWYVDTRLLFYRRDLFERAGVRAMPDTWAGFTQALDALQRAGTPHPLLLPVNEFEPLLAFALQGDEPLLRDGGRYGNFRSAGFRRALGFYMERFASGQAPSISAGEIANLWQEFGRGTFAAYISGPWNIGELARRLPASLRDSWATAPLPGPRGPGASTAGGASLVIFRRSRRRADAMRLLAYLSRPDVQLRFHALTGDLPPRRSAWSLQPLADDGRARAFATQLERVKPSPAVPEWERIAQEMQLIAARAVHDRWSVEQAAAAIDERVDGFLAKRRWMLERAARSSA